MLELCDTRLSVRNWTTLGVFRELGDLWCFFEGSCVSLSTIFGTLRSWTTVGRHQSGLSKWVYHEDHSRIWCSSPLNVLRGFASLQQTPPSNCGFCHGNLILPVQLEVRQETMQMGSARMSCLSVGWSCGGCHALWTRPVTTKPWFWPPSNDQRPLEE